MITNQSMHLHAKNMKNWSTFIVVCEGRPYRRSCGTGVCVCVCLSVSVRACAYACMCVCVCVLAYSVKK